MKTAIPSKEASRKVNPFVARIREYNSGRDQASARVAEVTRRFPRRNRRLPTPSCQKTADRELSEMNAAENVERKEREDLVTNFAPDSASVAEDNRMKGRPIIMVKSRRLATPVSSTLPGRT